ARVQFLVTHDRVPVGDAIVSLVWSRVAEALALVLLILVAPLFLHVPAPVRQAQLAGLALVALVGLALLEGRWTIVAGWLPVPIRAKLSALVAVASPRRLWLPVLLSLGNWVAQWLTFHWAIEAVHVPVSYAASFTALVVSNIGGIMRVTPANVGVVQAAMVVALLPFGIAPEHAVAAGLALQALQVLPVLVMGAAIGGWRGLVPGAETAAVAGAAQE
ncbi:MAG: lysylphosphatidylglycerol synthase domain-containing protein, partial [Gemmatimonadales bacterium]